MSIKTVLFLMTLIGIGQSNMLFGQNQSEWLATIKDDVKSNLPVINSRDVTIEFKLDKGNLEADLLYNIEFESYQSNNIKDEFVIFLDENRSLHDVFVNGKRYHLHPSTFLDYNSEGIFHSDTKISVVDINYYKKGELKNFRYRIALKDIKYLNTEYFHTKYPVKNASVTVKIPDWLKLDIQQFNFEDYNIKSSKIEGKKGTVNHTYSTTYLNKWHNEDDIEGPSYIYPHLLLLPKSYSYNGKKKVVFEKLDDLYGWYAHLVNEIGNEPDGLENLVNEITASAQTRAEKLKAIYYWVQDNIRYIAFEDGIAGFKPEACQNVLENKYGDCKGMANLAAEMLRIAGFDARLTWLGTKRISYTYDYPSLAVDNHMIVSVLDGDEVTYLDPTADNSAIDNIPYNIQGQEVLIQDGENFIRKKIPNQAYTVNAESYKMNLKLEGDQLKGGGNYLSDGAIKARLLNAFSFTEASELNKEIEDYLESWDKNISIDIDELKNIHDRDKKIDIDFDVAIDNKISSFNNQTYVAIDPFKKFEGSRIDEDRGFNLALDYGSVDAIDITFEIPLGGLVTYIPENFEAENEDFKISISYSKSDRIINYKAKYEFPKDVISVANFEAWNKAVDQLKKQYNEQIIIEKK